jgi:DNA-binding NtrC family response regulator
VRRGTFREDLYFRLSGVSLVIPPLRERPTELEPLARTFIEGLARNRPGQVPELAPDALQWLHRYAWPGNIRELRNVIERAMLLAGDAPLTADHLPLEKMGATLPSGPPVLRPPPASAYSNARAIAGRPQMTGSPTMPPRPPPPPPMPRMMDPNEQSGATTDDLRRQLVEAERDRIIQALESCAGNQTRAAKELGISRRTLVSRLDAFGIARPRKAPDKLD